MIQIRFAIPCREDARTRTANFVPPGFREALPHSRKPLFPPPSLPCPSGCRPARSKVGIVFRYRHSEKRERLVRTEHKAGHHSRIPRRRLLARTHFAASLWMPRYLPIPCSRCTTRSPSAISEKSIGARPPLSRDLRSARRLRARALITTKYFGVA